MLQIRKIREYTPRNSSVSKKYDAPFEPNITAQSIDEIFSQSKSIVEQIPENERYNIYYTLGHVPADTDPKNRKWASQDVLPFDIDGIDIIDETAPAAYKEVIADALNIDINKCGYLFSGNGLQLLIKLKTNIDNYKYFDENGKYYKALCDKLNRGLRNANLGGEADTSAFAANRLFRMPLTLNKKPDKPMRWTSLITNDIVPLDYDIQKESGIPIVNDDDQITEKQLGYFKIDTPNVLNGCDFLKYVKENQSVVNEPEWYAALSILGRLDDANLIHEYSSAHPSYNIDHTIAKSEQAVAASGPRTCDNINQYYGKCAECPNYKKVPSPISIKGENFIATSHSGFHLVTKKGTAIPQPNDLRKFYHESKPYVNVKRSHFTYNGTYYDYIDDEFIDQFAQDHYYPDADNKKCTEFRGLIKRTHLEPENFFNTDRKLNLKNGILNIDNMNLIPHTPDLGFQYQLDFNHDPLATAPTFDKFLEGITCGNNALKANLLEYMGYCLANDKPKAEKILILSGEGSNGKSTFLDIITALGSNAMTSINAEDMKNAFYKQQLDGALFNLFEEMPEFVNKRFWEDMKGLITGKSITVSRKGKDPYTFYSKAKFIMTCNELPKGATPNHGYFRRLLVVPFNAQFEGKDKDRTIGDRIINDEMSGVINMVMEGYHRLKANDWAFTQDQVLDDAVANYALEADNVARWCEDHVSEGKAKPDSKYIGVGKEVQRKLGSTTTLNVDVTGLIVKELYAAYAVAMDDGNEKVESRQIFYRRLNLWLKRKQKTGLVLRQKKRFMYKGNSMRGPFLENGVFVDDAAY